MPLGSSQVTLQVLTAIGRLISRFPGSTSMERLSDIIDQNPELNNSDEIGQISLPAPKEM